MSEDEQKRQIEMATVIARMDERSQGNAEKLDRLLTIVDGHTVIFEKHAERISSLESAKGKLLGIIAGVSIGGSAIGSKIASMLGGNPPPTPPGHP